MSRGAWGSEESLQVTLLPLLRLWVLKITKVFSLGTKFFKALSHFSEAPTACFIVLLLLHIYTLIFFFAIEKKKKKTRVSYDLLPGISRPKYKRAAPMSNVSTGHWATGVLIF